MIDLDELGASLGAFAATTGEVSVADVYALVRVVRAALGACDEDGWVLAYRSRELREALAPFRDGS